ncbi:LptA/OstA family protein [Sphingomicrobium flavum]|uniref:LptA/OstA family protein n=1 Tax=Sphingomicrobium flavum TaxID=1229164 RepID=UPI0021ADBA3F|nr:LptA/OstA family protein [Sphingomicrobium flavum]
MSNMHAKPILAALLLIAASGASAASQERSSLLGGHDINAEVLVNSNDMEVQDREDRAVFVGNVVVQQGALTLRTERLRLAYSTGGGLEIDRLDASGGVVVTRGDETARSDFAVYDLDRKIITMIGNVRFSQGPNELKGARLNIDLDSGRAVLSGGPPGVESQNGRVTGRFTVPQRGN